MAASPPRADNRYGWKSPDWREQYRRRHHRHGRKDRRHHRWRHHRRGRKTTTGGIGATGGTTTTGGTTGDAGAATTGWATIHNDFFWYDTDGNLINVRSGALRKFGDLYYWYGGAPNDHNQTCYSSPDLVHWTYKGYVLTTTGDANRMDILYNATTQQYVIFLKYIGNGAYFGIATGSTPDGQFTFKSQTLVDGFVIGDMSMYQDDDGTAYLAYVWWETGANKEHGIYRMSADYLTLDTRMYLWNEGSREAPHMFKRNGVYYYGVSETNGIDPSATRYYTATNLTGPWSAATMLTTPGSTVRTKPSVISSSPSRARKGPSTCTMATVGNPREGPGQLPVAAVRIRHRSYPRDGLLPRLGFERGRRNLEGL